MCCRAAYLDCMDHAKREFGTQLNNKKKRNLQNLNVANEKNVSDRLGAFEYQIVKLGNHNNVSALGAFKYQS